jgi:hypothetical protein
MDWRRDGYGIQYAFSDTPSTVLRHALPHIALNAAGLLFILLLLKVDYTLQT